MSVCQECGKQILPKQWKYILCILNDPEFCSRSCAKKYIRRERGKVDDYLLEVMMTKTREE